MLFDTFLPLFRKFLLTHLLYSNQSASPEPSPKQLNYNLNWITNLLLFSTSVICVYLFHQTDCKNLRNHIIFNPQLSTISAKSENKI